MLCASGSPSIASLASEYRYICSCASSPDGSDLPLRENSAGSTEVTFGLEFAYGRLASTTPISSPSAILPPADLESSLLDASGTPHCEMKTSPVPFKDHVASSFRWSY
ncbi:hypothetical protein KC19_3G202900 [Ceratodon purpureus]|uniref:Uncharacterized protein n=1 Tax=Ceratodon purpureus TaxID=3225 RepID=A0A8T0IKL6_CERPU|nr:hypothetical protein KC19_3G202900 [Ceratodon purpureus]